MTKRNETLSMVGHGLMGWSKYQLEKTCKCGKSFKTYNTQRTLCADCIEKAQAITESDDLYQKQNELERIAYANIPPKLKLYTFQNRDNKIHPKEMKQAFQYATNQERKSLVIYSPVSGVGKTFMAMCIGNYVLIELKKRIKFVSSRDLFIRIKDSYENGGEREGDILDELTKCDLVILDDVGKDNPTEWYKNTYWSIFDKLMNYNIPTIVTTNKNPKNNELPTAIGKYAYSRLMGMCDGVYIELYGGDLR